MIYFIEDADGERIKIGTTIRLVPRLRNLKQQYGPGLRVLAIIDGGRHRERATHDRFAHLHIDGEWFARGRDLMDFIAAEGRPWTKDDEAKDGHARIMLPDAEYNRLQRAAGRYRLSVSAYIRMAVMETVEADEATEVRR